MRTLPAFKTVNLYRTERRRLDRAIAHTLLGSAEPRTRQAQHQLVRHLTQLEWGGGHTILPVILQSSAVIETYLSSCRRYRETHRVGVR